MAPRSMSMRMTSSTKNGLPSAFLRISVRTLSGSDRQRRGVGQIRVPFRGALGAEPLVPQPQQRGGLLGFVVRAAGAHQGLQQIAKQMIRKVLAVRQAAPLSP